MFAAEAAIMERSGTGRSRCTLESKAGEGTGLGGWESWQLPGTHLRAGRAIGATNDSKPGKRA